jgi:hypothetical protein
MPMQLDTATGEWHCDVCKLAGKPQMPPPIEDRKDPSRPKGWWLRLAIVILVISTLALLRVFIF